MSAHAIAPVLSDLHLLTVLAQTRSFTQAARRLGVSKASVSMRIGELERAAGVLLVRRTTRSVTLTEAGQRLVDDIQGAFTRIEHSYADVQALAGQPRGLVRVSAPVALGRQHVVPRLPAFFARHPDIRIELELQDRLSNLAQEGFDLAIRHASAAPDTHVAWTLCETRSMLVASRDYLARRGEPTHPSELARHDCLLYLRDAAAVTWHFEPAASRRREGTERLSVPVAGPLKANNSEALREAAQGGLGIGLLPDFSAAQALQEGRLQQVLPGWRPVGFFGDRIFALRPWSAQVPRAVGCLVDFLREALRGGFGPAQRRDA